jgi:hypothetical protein
MSTEYGRYYTAADIMVPTGPAAVRKRPRLPELRRLHEGPAGVARGAGGGRQGRRRRVRAVGRR